MTPIEAQPFPIDALATISTWSARLRPAGIRKAVIEMDHEMLPEALEITTVRPQRWMGDDGPHWVVWCDLRGSIVVDDLVANESGLTFPDMTAALAWVEAEWLAASD